MTNLQSSTHRRPLLPVLFAETNDAGTTARQYPWLASVCPCEGGMPAPVNTIRPDMVGIARSS